MARVFSAIDIEDKELLEELQHVQEKLDLGFKTVDPEKMHITLQFFKDIDEQEIEKVKKAIDGIEQKSFKSEINGIGAFPSEDFIRVVWAGAENHSIREIYKQSKSHSVKSDSNNDFTPHVTLMRVNDITQDRKKKLQKTIEEFRDYVFGRMKVDKVKLFESHLGPHGTQYRELHVKEL